MAGTVIVGCKLPNGLVAEVNSKTVHFNGANSAVIIGGHGITENVDAEFWQAWLTQNKDLVFVQKGLVFADAKAVNTKAESQEKAEEKTGLEPVKQGAGKEIQTLKLE